MQPFDTARRELLKIDCLDIFRLRMPPATGAANFYLRNIANFRLFGCPQIPDRTIAQADSISS